MKILLKILLFPIILILLTAVFFAVIPNGIRESILSNIPLVNQFVQSTSSTRLAGITQQRFSELECARFSVDFLLHLENKDGYYIAIYPYTVTAGFAKPFSIKNSDNFFTSNASSKNAGKILQIELSEPTITSVDSESDSVLVIRDTLKQNDWNAYIAPVTQAFKRKAADYAIESGILERCVENIKGYLSTIYSTSNIQLSFTGEKPDKNLGDSAELVKMEAANISVSYTVQKSAFLQTIPDFLSRDDSIFIPTGNSSYKLQTGTARKGIWHGTISSWLDSFNGEHTMLLYRDPFNPQKKAIASLADNFYRTSYALLPESDGGSIIYVMSDAENNQTQQDKAAADCLYLAMSAETSNTTKQYNESYANFSRLYDKSAEALQKSEFSILSNYLATMKQLNIAQGFTKQNSDLQVLDSVNALLYRHEKLESGVSALDDWVEIAQILKLNDFEKMDEPFRKKSLAILDNLNEARLNLKSYFLKNSTQLTLTDYEKKSFIDDLIQNGDVINRDLFSSLEPELRKEYLQRILSTKIDKVNIESDKTDTFILTGTSYDGVFNKKKKGPDFIRDKLNQEAFQDNVYLVFSESHWYGDEYQAVIFGREGLYLFDNFTSIIETKPCYSLYSDITTFGDGFFSIDGYSYKDSQIQKVLCELQLIYTNENAYGSLITGSIEEYLKSYALNLLFRP